MANPAIRTSAPPANEDFGAALFDLLPVGVYLCDAEGRLVRYNDAAAELWGRRPRLGEDGERFCGSVRLSGLDGQPIPHAECPMAEALATGTGVRDERIVVERPDGSRVVALVNIEVLRDAEGRVTGAVNVFRDGETVGVPGDAELGLRRLAAIVESSDDAILSKDADGVITSWNGGAERLFGYTAEEAVGRPVTILIPEDRQDEEPAILARIRRGERIDHYETVRRRKDGALLDISLSVSPIADRSGRIVGASKIARDISDRRRADRLKDLALREMDHRVKNLFALANGIVNLSGREAGSVEELVADLQDRFSALANAHSLTLQTHADADPRVAATLHGLIAKVIAPYLGEEDAGRLTVEGVDIPLGRAWVTTFALLLHEFATNAVKYGALSVPDGRIRIECSERGDAFHLVWRETGLGRSPSEPTREGFGSRLARAAIGTASGGAFSREFTEDGVEISLIVPRDRIMESDRLAG